MIYIKIGVSIMLLLTAVLGGIPSIIEDGLDFSSICIFVCITVIAGFLIKSSYHDITHPADKKQKKQTKQSWIRKELEVNKNVKIEQEEIKYNELKEKCKLESDPFKKLHLIREYSLKPYNKLADKIISNKDNISLRENKTRELISAGLINEKDLQTLLDIFDSDYKELQKEKESKKQKRQEQMEILSEQRRNNPKQIHKANKKKGIVSCPKCGSTSITTSNKKLSLTRGVVGGALLGPLGAGVGAVTSKKVYCVCMNCGHKWKP